jgi:hypothetical protein
MRIDELTFPATIEDAGRILQRSGYEQIGHDASYGLVFHKPGERFVLKIYANDDDAFPRFVDFCRRQSNIHFPRFARGSVLIRGTNYSAVKTELLTEGDPARLSEVAGYFKNILLLGWPTSPNGPNAVKFINNSPQQAATYLPWLKANLSLGQAFALLKAEFSGMRDIHFDLHHENMMMRGETIVIIDPISP